jgi:hypothetical protein
MADDLNTLPIVNITPSGIWIPLTFNETQPGLSFADPLFDRTLYAQGSRQESPTAHVFYDAQEDLVPGDLHFFDPDDTNTSFVGKVFHLSLDYDKIIDSVDVDHFL